MTWSLAKRRFHERHYFLSPRPSGYRGFLSPGEVQRLREARASGMKVYEIAELFGVSASTVTRRTKDL